ASSSDMWQPVVVLGAMVVYVGFVVTGQIANWLVCGQWAQPAGLLSPLGFVVNADTTAFGSVEGCAADLVTTSSALAVYAVLVACVIVGAALVWLQYRESDKAFIRQLRRRDGIARAPEIRKQVGSVVTK